jgi:hypothetical protein
MHSSSKICCWKNGFANFGERLRGSCRHTAGLAITAVSNLVHDDDETARRSEVSIAFIEGEVWIAERLRIQSR